ncbi:MAG: zf-HC2 domain-containing protein [Catenulispora sp.]|nr:zf-HC2 domain-containing protein [Catenulispora sp.]
MVTDSAASSPDTHLDPDRLADLAEGLLDPASAGAAQQHLASCPACAEDFALITMDAGLFTADSGLAARAAAELAAPVPIPAEVAIRIEAALHREPPLTPLAPPTSAPHHSVAPRRNRRFRLWAGSLAGASLVVAGAFAGIAALSSTGADSQKSSASGASSGDLARNPALSDSAPSDSKAAGVAPNAAGTAAGGGALNPHSSAAAAPSGASAASALSIQNQAEQLLKKTGQSQPQAAGSTGGATEPAPFLCAPAGWQGYTPLGMTAITYQGQSAELLVYPKPGDATRATVYVVSLTGCTATAPGTVLYSTEVPRR